MNESELENELGKLRPAAPSQDLEGRIAVGITHAMPRRRTAAARGPEFLMRWLDRLLWSGLGAAAAALALVSMRTQEAHVVSRTAELPDSSGLRRVFAGEEDLGWHEEGVQFDAHGRPMLKLSRTAVEREAWADLRDAGVVQVEKPRQEVLWVPVTLH